MQASKKIKIVPTTTWDEFQLSCQGATKNARTKFPIYAAAYLPWLSRGEAIDFSSFEKVLCRIWACGAIPVVNADTGFAFHPAVSSRKVEILQWIRSRFPGRPYVAAVTPPKGKAETFSADAYNAEIDPALENGATQIMVMISRGLVALKEQQLVDAFASLKLPKKGGILHELTSEFVDFGRQFSPFEFYGILSLPGFGMSKTSDLFGNCMNPRMALKLNQGMDDVLITSGVDYKIMEAYQICDGILMGAATIWPEMYALLWRLFLEGKETPSTYWKFETLATNLQSVATHQFLPDADYFTSTGSYDVGGYRNHTALYLLAQGTISHADQPTGTEARHLRELSLKPIRSNCLLIRQTLEIIGEDPHLINLM